MEITGINPKNCVFPLNHFLPILLLVQYIFSLMQKRNFRGSREGVIYTDWSLVRKKGKKFD